MNVAAERAVLAGLCQFNQELAADITEILDTDCFSNTDNQIYYSIIVDILRDSQKVDFPSIVAKSTMLGRDITADKSQSDYVRSLFGFNVTKENAKKNAAIVRKLQIARHGQAIARDMNAALSRITGAESVDEIVSLIEKPVFEYTTNLGDTSDDKTVNLADLLPGHIEKLAEEQNVTLGIPSPWPIYNQAIGGGRRKGYVYLIGARPKVGKSSFAINDAIHLCKLGIPVLYLDTEMSKEDTMNRLISSMSRVDIATIEKGGFTKNDFLNSQVHGVSKTTAGQKLYYRKVAGKPFDEILSIVRRWIVQDVGLNGDVANDCMIIYDYFKLMDSSALDNMQEYQALGFQIQNLTDFCNKYKVACSAFVQLNRDGIDKNTSDIVSQSDRLVWLCSSLAFLKRKSSDEIRASGPMNGNIKLIVTPEQRFGPGLEDNDWINIAFDKNKCVMTELNTRSAEQKDSSIPLTDEGTDGDDEAEFSDDDFDRYDFGDDKYRKN